MGPTSPLVLGILVLMSAALLVVLVRVRWLAVKIVAGVLAISVGMIAGVTGVNDYYGYYRTWGDLVHDLTNAAPSGIVVAASRRDQVLVLGGTVNSFVFAGPVSGITRSGYIYLPPQYNQLRYRHTEFPVLELLHGFPGRPRDWIYALHVNTILDRAIAARHLGPMVVVMPSVSGGNSAQECLNSARAQDETFLTSDVRQDVEARFRVSRDPAQWGLLGFSSGGYCAANLALRNRGLFGSTASLDGYYQASAGPAAKVLKFDPALMAANSPVAEAGQLNAHTAPIPAMFLSVGTGNAADLIQARLLANAIRPAEGITLVTVPRQGHNFYAWQSVLPLALSWTWQQLAPPDLRVDFPATGSSSVLVVPPAPKTGHRSSTQHSIPVRHLALMPTTLPTGTLPRRPVG